MLDPTDAIIALHVAMVAWLLFRLPGFIRDSARQDERGNQPDEQQDLDE